jgi:hypothetical protein
LHFGGAFFSIVPAIDPTPEETKVRQVNPTEGIERGPGDERQELCAQKPEAER